MHNTPRFGGFFTDSGMLILQMKSEYSEKSDADALSENERKRNENERAKKDILKLLTTSPSAPILTTDQGKFTLISC